MSLLINNEATPVRGTWQLGHWTADCNWACVEETKVSSSTFENKITKKIGTWCVGETGLGGGTACKAVSVSEPQNL